MRRREPLPAILTRYTDAGQAGVEQHSLNLTLARDLGQLLLVRPMSPECARDFPSCHGSQVAADESACTRAEALQTFDFGGHDAASSFRAIRSATRRRCASGVPKSVLAS